VSFQLSKGFGNGLFVCIHEAFVTSELSLSAIATRQLTEAILRLCGDPSSIVPSLFQAVFDMLTSDA
jgi:hypothetical protein